MLDEKVKTNAFERFTEYLRQRKLRNTPERSTILGKILSIDDHFDVDSLYLSLEKDTYHVSRATVYNTVNLLCECGILRKLQFGDQQAQYEKLLSKANHHHLICTKCGKIKDVKDPEFVLYMNSKKYNAFTISYFSFYVYGICNNCLRRLKQSKKQ